MKKFQQVVDTLGLIGALNLYADKLCDNFWEAYSLMQLLEFLSGTNEKLKKPLIAAIVAKAKKFDDWKLINESVAYFEDLKQKSSEEMEMLARSFEQLVTALNSIPRSYYGIMSASHVEMSIPNRHRWAKIWKKMISSARTIDQFKYLWNIDWRPRERKPAGKEEAELIERNFLKYNKDQLSNISVLELRELFYSTAGWECAELNQLLSNMLIDRSLETEYDLAFWISNNMKLFSDDRIITEIRKCIPTFNDWLKLFLENGKTWYIKKLCLEATELDFSFSNYRKACREIEISFRNDFETQWRRREELAFLFYPHLKRTASSFNELLRVIHILLDKENKCNRNDIREIFTEINKLEMTPRQLYDLAELSHHFQFERAYHDKLWKIIRSKYSILELNLEEWLAVYRESKYRAIREIASSKINQLL